MPEQIQGIVQHALNHCNENNLELRLKLFVSSGVDQKHVVINTRKPLEKNSFHFCLFIDQIKPYIRHISCEVTEPFHQVVVTPHKTN